jgi:hypothetical protein
MQQERQDLHKLSFKLAAALYVAVLLYFRYWILTFLKYAWAVSKTGMFYCGTPSRQIHSLPPWQPSAIVTPSSVLFPMTLFKLIFGLVARGNG